MDEATKAHLEAMEARLMTRIASFHAYTEKVFSQIENVLNAEADLVRYTNALINRLIATAGDHSRRITDLEDKA